MKLKFDTLHYVLIGSLVLAIAVVIYLYMNRTKEGIQMPQPRSAPPSQNPNGAPTLVLFHADWCPHCKDVMGTWGEVEKITQGKLQCIKIESKQIDPKAEIKGFPTIRFYPHGLASPDYIKYEGDRSLQSILDFASQNFQKAAAGAPGPKRPEQKSNVPMDIEDTPVPST